jgi:type I restriction enzyme S subunit
MYNDTERNVTIVDTLPENTELGSYVTITAGGSVIDNGVSYTTSYDAQSGRTVVTFTLDPSVVTYLKSSDNAEAVINYQTKVLSQAKDEDFYTNEAIMAFNERYPYEAETGLRISKKWIYYTFLYKDWLENAAQAVKGRTLNKESIGNSNIIVPKYELQQQFVEIATQAEATKESLRKSIENIDQVIKSLINQ